MALINTKLKGSQHNPPHGTTLQAGSHPLPQLEVYPFICS